MPIDNGRFVPKTASLASGKVHCVCAKLVSGQGSMNHLIFVASLVLSTAAQADQPSVGATLHRFSSPDRQIVATAFPGSDTRVQRRTSGETLWRIPGWHSLLYLSNDGLHAAVVQSGLNLIPLDSQPELVLVTIWTRGEKSREISVQDIAPNLSILRKTTSHYEWGSVEGFDDKGDLVIERADGEHFRFAISAPRQR